MRVYYSPLRYPGGKSRLAPYIASVIERSGLSDGEYVEPYAGGAAVGLALLMEEYVSRIYINDLSRSVYAFWLAVLDHTEELCRRISDTRVSVTEWRRQRAVQKSARNASILDLAFSTFFLNRTSRSGIIRNGGVIGGQQQRGSWKLDARYNKRRLIERIERIAHYRDRIQLYRYDALVLLRRLVPKLGCRAIAYLDPPYYHQARGLYERWYRERDHEKVAGVVHGLPMSWIVSYDDCREIRRLYRGYRSRHYGVSYSASTTYRGAEVLFLSHDLEVPSGLSPINDRLKR